MVTRNDSYSYDYMVHCLGIKYEELVLLHSLNVRLRINCIEKLTTNPGTAL